MKNIIGIVLCSGALISCSKTYECECVSSPPSGGRSSNTSTITATKNGAKDECKKREKNYLYTTCAIK